MKHGGWTLALLHFRSDLTDSIDVMGVNSCPLEDKTFQLERAVWPGEGCKAESQADTWLGSQRRTSL